MCQQDACVPKGAAIYSSLSESAACGTHGRYSHSLRACWACPQRRRRHFIPCCHFQVCTPTLVLANVAILRHFSRVDLPARKHVSEKSVRTLFVKCCIFSGESKQRGLWEAAKQFWSWMIKLEWAFSESDTCAISLYLQGIKRLWYFQAWCGWWLGAQRWVQTPIDAWGSRKSPFGARPLFIKMACQNFCSGCPS